MRRLLFLLLIVLLVLPGLPFVLKPVVLTVLHRLGIEGEVARVGGYLPLGLTLEGVDLKAPEGRLRARRLRLSYNLLGLLSRRLPLSVAIEDGQISTRWKALFPEEGPSSPPPVAPVLLDLRLDSVRVELAEARDWALPEVRVRLLGRGPYRVRFMTADGAGQGTLDLKRGTFRFDADLKIARYWYPELEAGRVTGVFHFDGPPRVEAEVKGARGRVVGFVLRDVGGTVRFVDDRVEAELAGRGLHGPVHATGVVDTRAERYDFSVEAEPELAALARHFGAALPVGGRGRLELRVRGWETPRVEGRFQGAPVLLGQKLALQGTLGFDGAFWLDGRVFGHFYDREATLTARIRGQRYWLRYVDDRGSRLALAGRGNEGEGAGTYVWPTPFEGKARLSYGFEGDAWWVASQSPGVRLPLFRPLDLSGRVEGRRTGVSGQIGPLRLLGPYDAIRWQLNATPLVYGSLQGAGGYDGRLSGRLTYASTALTLPITLTQDGTGFAFKTAYGDARLDGEGFALRLSGLPLQLLGGFKLDADARYRGGGWRGGWRLYGGAGAVEGALSGRATRFSGKLWGLGLRGQAGSGGLRVYADEAVFGYERGGYFFRGRLTHAGVGLEGELLMRDARFFGDLDLKLPPDIRAHLKGRGGPLWLESRGVLALSGRAWPDPRLDGRLGPYRAGPLALGRLPVRVRGWRVLFPGGTVDLARGRGALRLPLTLFNASLVLGVEGDARRGTLWLEGDGLSLKAAGPWRQLALSGTLARGRRVARLTGEADLFDRRYRGTLTLSGIEGALRFSGRGAAYRIAGRLTSRGRLDLLATPAGLRLAARGFDLAPFGAPVTLSGMLDTEKARAGLTLASPYGRLTVAGADRWRLDLSGRYLSGRGVLDPKAASLVFTADSNLGALPGRLSLRYQQGALLAEGQGQYRLPFFGARDWRFSLSGDTWKLEGPLRLEGKGLRYQGVLDLSQGAVGVHGPVRGEGARYQADLTLVLPRGQGKAKVEGAPAPRIALDLPGGQLRWRDGGLYTGGLDLEKLLAAFGVNGAGRVEGALIPGDRLHGWVELAGQRARFAIRPSGGLLWFPSLGAGLRLRFSEPEVVGLGGLRGRLSGWPLAGRLRMTRPFPLSFDLKGADYRVELKAPGLSARLKGEGPRVVGAAAYRGPCGTGRLTLEGTLPALRGRGELSWRCGLEAAGPLRLDEGRLRWQAPLAVEVSWQRGLQLAVKGEAPVSGGGRLHADLTWRPSGFSGGLDLRWSGVRLFGQAKAGPLELALTGQGLSGQLELSPGFLLSGRMGLDRRLGPLGLSARARLAGSLFAPRLTGEGRLEGRQAALPFAFGYGPGPWFRARGGGLDLNLSGRYLDARLDLDLKPWVGLPLHLSGRAAEDLDAFRLPLRLSGPDLEAMSELRARPFSLVLKGHYREGPFALEAGPGRFSSRFDLPALGVLGKLDYVAGRGFLGRIRARVLGEPVVLEPLGMSLSVRGRGTLFLDLARRRASGALRVGPLELRGEEGTLWLRGRAGVAGLSGQLDLARGRFTWHYRGPLPGGAGQAGLGGTWPGRWLEGSVEVLGKRIALESEGGAVRLAGPGVSGRLDAAGLALSFQNFWGLSGRLEGGWGDFSGRLRAGGTTMDLRRRGSGLDLVLDGALSGHAEISPEGLGGELRLPGGRLRLGPGWQASGRWLEKPLSLSPEGIRWDGLFYDPRRRRFSGRAVLWGLQLVGQEKALTARYGGYRLALELAPLSLRLTHVAGTGAVRWSPAGFVGELRAPGVRLVGEGKRLLLLAEHPGLGDTPFDRGSLRATLDAGLSWALSYHLGPLVAEGGGRGISGRIRVESPWGGGRIELRPAGPRGELRLEKVPLGPRRLDLTFLDGQFSARLIGPAGEVDGRFTLEGWRPLEAEVFTPGLELGKVVELGALLPGLRGRIGGSVYWRPGTLALQVGSAALGAPKRAYPFALTWRNGDGRLYWDGLDARFHVERRNLHLSSKLTGFDLGVFGALLNPELPGEVRASGALALSLPLDDPLAGSLKLALERVRVAGKHRTLTGHLAAEYAGRTLFVRDLDFSGDGRWRGGGRWRLGQGGDLWLDFEGTDVSPLLSLIPRWARLKPRYRGDFSLRAEGERLQLRARGDWGLGTLSGRLRLDTDYAVGSGARIRGGLQVDRPFVAEVELKGGGPLTHLVVEGVANLAFEGLDPVEGVAFQVTWPKARLSARWQGVRLTGRLVPLDLKAEGPLKVGAPGYYLPRAEGKAALYLRQGADGRYHLGGDLAVEQALLSLPEKPLPVREGGARPPLVFDALRIHAERGVLVRAPLVEGELGGALFLGGSAEDPYLSGEARALSGSFVLFNRRFELIEGRARFSPEHGLLPEVFLRARSENPEGTIYLVAEGRVVRQDGKLAFELDPCLSLAPVADLLSCKAEPQEAAAARLLGLEGSSAEGVAGAAVENLLVNQLENALSRALGLDVVRVETHVLTGQGLESTRFTLGKFITPEVYLAYDWSEATGSKLYARVRRDGVTLEFRTDFAPDPSPEFSLRYAFAPELSGLLELARDRFRLGFEWRP